MWYKLGRLAERFARVGSINNNSAEPPIAGKTRLTRSDANAHLQAVQLDLRGTMTGRLMGIARRGARRVPMQEVSEGLVTTKDGLIGDFKGAKYPRRQITVLAREDWDAALAEIGHPELPWTARRANLLVEGVELPRAAGGILRIGPVRLEITAQTYPCARMEEAQAGLLSALARDWRGGVTCRVLDGGPIALGGSVDVLLRPKRAERRLPG
jgi:MOSC domain-containing protein YiiM